MIQHNFSETGRFLFLQYYFMQKDLETDEIENVDSTIEAVETGTWVSRARYTTPGNFWGLTYTCGDEQSAFFVEVPERESSTKNLVLWHLTTGDVETLFPVDRFAHHPYHPGDWSGVHCDPEEGVLYLGVIDGEVTAIDQTTGAVVRRYATGRPANLRFRVNEQARRLYVWDWDNYQLLSFDLDTAEPLGELTYWTYTWSDLPRGMIQTGPGEVLMWKVGHSPDTSGLFFVLVDLEALTVENIAVLEDKTVSDVWGMGYGEYRVVAGTKGPTDYVSDLSIVDALTGQVEYNMDMEWHGQGQWFPLPELGRIYIVDWAAPQGEAARVYSYPELELLHVGRSPNDFEEMQWVSDGQFIAMESYFSDRFGIYDPMGFRVVDDFHLCEHVAANSLQIDPSGRWAAVMCRGTDPDEIDSIDDVPRGAGVAVVDLDRYR